MELSGCCSGMKAKNNLRKIRRGLGGHTVEHGKNKVKFSSGSQDGKT